MATDGRSRVSEPQAQTPPEKSRPAVAKITVNLPWKVWEALIALAEENHVSKTEALRRAISTEVFRHTIQREGSRLVVEKPDGTRERVHFPY
jgi:hypothetical protein